MAAFRSTRCFRQISNTLRGSSSYSTAAPANVKQYVSTPNIGTKIQPKKAWRGDYVAVYVAIGMIALSTMLGLRTALLELKHSPQVRVKKKMRETLPEVEEPDTVVDEADRFIKKSFFRKVAHVQDFHHGEAVPDGLHGDLYGHVKPKAESLKDVGVDPKFRVLNH